MKEDLARLIALQDIDLQMKKLDDEVNAGLADIERRKESIAEKKEKIAVHTEAISEGETRRRDLEALIEDELARIKDRQAKLMNVQTNREYQSLLKEIEEAKKNNKDREEEIVHLMEQAENLAKKISELKNTCGAEEELLAEAEKKVSGLTKSVEDKKGKFEKSREKQAQSIPENLRRRYEQLRDNRNGLAIVGVTNAICQGCFMNIPPQQYNEVMRGDELLSCPTCQRLMFHLSEDKAEALADK